MALYCVRPLKSLDKQAYRESCYQNARKLGDYAYFYLGKPRIMTKTNPIWDTNFALDVNHEFVLQTRFVSGLAGEAITEQVGLTLNTSLLELTDAVRQIVSERGYAAEIKSNQIRRMVVQSEGILAFVHRPGEGRNQGRVYMEYSSDEDTGADRRPYIGPWSVEASGNRDDLDFLFTKLRERFKESKFAQIRWWYTGSTGEFQFRTIYLPKPETTLRDEFYPDLPEGAQSYINRYLASECSVMLMAGPPGTGKTTMLRHMLCEHDLSAMVVYDEDLMKRDQLFHSFLFDADIDMLVIEDADTILASRESEQNKLMSRFLNVSDGLIKLPNKKLVFTTNISDFGKVDPALMRPGRCFDVMHTRALDKDEAVRACRAAGLRLPTEARTYTLAELFNREYKPDVRSVGFTRRVG